MKQYVFITFILGFVWNSYLINQRWTLHPPFWEKLLFSYIVLMCSWKCFWLLMILYSYRDNNYTVFVSFLVWTLFFLGCIKLVTLITSVFLANSSLDQLLYWLVQICGMFFRKSYDGLAHRNIIFQSRHEKWLDCLSY